MNFTKLKEIPLDSIYLSICAPLIFLLIYILPPFQSPDEAAHFFRAVQVSQGEISPVSVRNSYRAGAGGLVPRSAISIVRHYCPQVNWSCVVQDRPSLVALVRRSAKSADDVRQPTEFSNTVIYLPLAHAIPAGAIATARALGLPALAWTYAGRLANALLAVSGTWLALYLLRGQRAAVVVFVVATLPMTLSLTPTMNADSGVISGSLLLLALCIGILHNRQRGWLWPILTLSILFAAAAKLAYLPLAFMPLICALTGRVPRSVCTGTILLAIATVAVTTSWSVAMHPYAFPISPDLRVNIPGQVAFLTTHPFLGLRAIMLSMILEAPHWVVQLIGHKLSAATVKLPIFFVALSVLTLPAALLAGMTSQRRPVLQLLIALLLFSCILSTFAFLYIQNTEVGGLRVRLYQGRYLLPILPFSVLVFSSFRWLETMSEDWLHIFAVLGGVFTTIGVSLFLGLRHWY